MLPSGESLLALLRTAAAAVERRRRRATGVPRGSHDIISQVRRTEESRSREAGRGG